MMELLLSAGNVVQTLCVRVRSLPACLSFFAPLVPANASQLGPKQGMRLHMSACPAVSSTASHLRFIKGGLDAQIELLTLTEEQ